MGENRNCCLLPSFLFLLLWLDYLKHSNILITCNSRAYIYKKNNLGLDERRAQAQYKAPTKIIKILFIYITQGDKVGFDNRLCRGFMDSVEK